MQEQRLKDIAIIETKEIHNLDENQILETFALIKKRRF